jgi:hypothetical protein
MSSTSVSLMQNVMKSPMSSHNEILDELHMKEPYMVILSCFMNKMKFIKCFSRVNFDNLHDRIMNSLVDLVSKI